MTFLGLSYLLVYIGAVSILFLFILMLINIRVSEIQIDTFNSIPLSIVTGILFNEVYYTILPHYVVYTENFMHNISDKIKIITFNAWDSNLWESSHITTLGNIMYTNYSMWLIIISLILLLSMIGVIVITINKASNGDKIFP